MSQHPGNGLTARQKLAIMREEKNRVDIDLDQIKTEPDNVQRYRKFLSHLRSNSDSDNKNDSNKIQISQSSREYLKEKLRQFRLKRAMIKDSEDKSDNERDSDSDNKNDSNKIQISQSSREYAKERLRQFRLKRAMIKDSENENESGED
jgi:hypothetical protein